MAETVVSVLIDDVRLLASVVSQDEIERVEVITWHDEVWHKDATRELSRRSWTHRRVSGPGEAVRSARGTFMIGWNCPDAGPGVLRSLVSAADRSPAKQGAVTANFDPMVLWRRDEFFGPTGRKGLAQAEAVAIGGEGPEIHPGLLVP